MICANCGFSNYPDVNFCIRCGRELDAEKHKESSDEVNQEKKPSTDVNQEEMFRRLEEILFRLNRIESVLGLSVNTAIVNKEMTSPPAIIQPPIVNERIQEPIIPPAPVPQHIIPPVQSPPPVSPIQAPWEAIIGGKWTLWVGVSAVFLALAFFLAYAWNYLGVTARFSIGFGLGLSFLGGGIWLRQRMEHSFGDGLSGAGLAILYLIFWAGYHEFQILSFLTAFVIMFCICTLGVALSMRFNTQILSVLSTIGGFLTPALLTGGNSGDSSPLTFLLYITMLITGVLVVSILKDWRSLIWLCFGSFVLLMIMWWDTNVTATYLWMVFSFMSVDFMLFLSAICFGGIIRREDLAHGSLLLVFSNAFFYTFFGHILLSMRSMDYMVAYYLTLGGLFAVLAWLTNTLRPENVTLKYAMAILSVFYITITIPIRVHEGWMVSAWILEAAFLLTAGIRFNRVIIYRIGFVIWGLALISLLHSMFFFPSRDLVLYLNERDFPLLIWLLANGWLVYTAIRSTWDERRRSFAQGLFSVSSIFGGAIFIPLEVDYVCHRYLDFGYGMGASDIMYVSAIMLGIYSICAFFIGMRWNLISARLTAFFVSLLTFVYVIGMESLGARAQIVPFINPRMLTFVTLAVTFASMGFLYVKKRGEISLDELILANNIGFIALTALLYGLTQESYLAFQYYSGFFGEYWYRTAQMGISLIWTLYAIAVLVGGIIRHARSFRLAGLGLLGLTVLKAVWIDLSFVGMPYRIFTFAGLGVGLIGISWLYSRYGIGRDVPST